MREQGNAGVTLAYFVHGRGRGHASRALTTVPALRRAGHRVRVFASADAVESLAGLSDVQVVPLCGRGATAVAQLGRRAWQDHSRLRALGARVVITDGDPAGGLAGRAAGLPVVSLGHGLVFRHCKLPARLPLADRTLEQVNSATSDGWASHHIPVHFLPVAPRRPGVTVARPDERSVAAVDSDQNDGFILAYFSGCDGTEAVRAVIQHDHRVVSFGEGVAPVAGATVRPFDRETFIEHLARCQGVMCTAGSNVLAEAIMMGKPVLALYPKNHREQRLNAVWVEAAQVGQAACLPRPKPAQIARFLNRLHANEFRRVDLREALPPVSEALVACVNDLVRRESR